MKFNFNEKQIELIQDVLFNQKLIWLEDEKEYRSDIKLIDECRNALHLCMGDGVIRISPVQLLERTKYEIRRI